jgi:hypothetical protein
MQSKSLVIPISLHVCLGIVYCATQRLYKNPLTVAWKRFIENVTTPIVNPVPCILLHNLYTSNNRKLLHPSFCMPSMSYQIKYEIIPT